VKVLITGGAGYIGSTIALACSDAGHSPLILDNLSTGLRLFADRYPFYEGDIADGPLVRKIFTDHRHIDAVIHCAASTIVTDSVDKPLTYYRNNIAKTIDLLGHLHSVGCDRMIFSSSAAIYASTSDGTVHENSPRSSSSPYSRTKRIVENVLRDICATGSLTAISLRYFNPVGADPKLRSGPLLARQGNVLQQLLDAYTAGTVFTINGADWPTKDGTAVRDYVHVWDVAQAHVAALTRIASTPVGTYDVVNIGSGAGRTVRELIDAFQRATGAQIDVREGPRRPGDVVGAYAQITAANTLLNWYPQQTLQQAIEHAIQWHAIHCRVPGSRDLAK
jgi:UDP-glucose 4-epimerase